MEQKDGVYENRALKIIPIGKLNLADENVEKMTRRVIERNHHADPEIILRDANLEAVSDRKNYKKGQLQSRQIQRGNQHQKNPEILLSASENVEMTDEDAEISENHAKEFRHGCLMEYLNMQLGLIKVYDQKILVQVIG